MKYKYNGQWTELTIKALDGMPIGSVIMFAGESIPTGWLVCDGSLLTSDSYPDLYTAIGVKYGGSGANFNLPNFKGRVAAGIDSNDINFNLLGKTGGESTHTLTVDEMPSHTHNTENICSYPEGVPNTHTGYGYNEISLNKSSYGSNIGATGGGQAHNNLQPYLVINYIIKATNTTPLAGSVVNAASSSTTDAYSCKYINDSTANNEQTTNKVTEITPWNSNVQYPSAKAVYNQIQGLKNSLDLNLENNYQDKYPYVKGNIVVHDGKKYVCFNTVEEYTFWDDQKTITEILTNGDVIAYIDDEFFWNQIMALWPELEGGSTQPLSLSIDERGYVTISCEAIEQSQTYSNTGSIEGALGISVNPSAIEETCTFIVNFDGCWAWIRDNTEQYTIGEVKTDKRWVDGSAIYRQVFTYDNLTLDSANVILPNSVIYNLGEIISFSATGRQGAGAWGFLNTKAHPTTKDWDCSMYYDTGIHAEFGSNGRNTAWHFNIIIEYTKDEGLG